MNRRPLLLIATAFALGIAVHAYHAVPAPVLFFWIILFGFGAWIMRPGIAAHLLLMLLFVALGCFYAQSYAALPEEHVGSLNRWERFNVDEIRGVILSEVEERRSGFHKQSFELGRLEFRIDGIWRTKQGRVLVNYFGVQPLYYGDRLRMTGKLHKPFSKAGDTFSYEEYLKRQGVFWIYSVGKKGSLDVLGQNAGDPLVAGLISLRFRMKQTLERYLTPLEAGLIQSLVFGGYFYIPEHIRDLFVRTGTAHILAISGMNIASLILVLSLGLRVLTVGIRIEAGLICGFLLFYLVLTGVEPSVARAVFMSSLVYLSLMFGRETEVFNTLGCAAFVLLLINPNHLFDIGFQLSFMGVFAILWISPVLNRWVRRLPFNWESRAVTWVVQALVVSAAAWIGVWGLIAYYFEIVTPITILANLPVIPLVAALMMTGIGLIAMAGIPFVAGTFAACIKILIWILLSITYGFSRIPYGYHFVTAPALSQLLLYYVSVFLIFALFRSRSAVKVQVPGYEYIN